MTEQNEIRFDEIFEPSFLEDVYKKFKEHIKKLDDGVYFTNIIKDEILTPSVWLKLHNKLSSMGIQYTEGAIAQFLVGNCYCILVPEMVGKGHKFNDIEKAHVTGYSSFVQMLGDEDYPWEQPEQQAKEMYEQTSKDFINTSFKWYLESAINIYNQEYPDKAIKNVKL